MSADPRVKAAVSHWAPRFVANGVPLSDFEDVTSRVTRWEDWCAAWSERAGVHESLGRKALAEGLGLTAGEHLTTAAVCYHFGKFLFVDDVAQMRAAHANAVACRNDALPHLRPAGLRVGIPYEGRTLYGNLRRPQGVARPPVVVMCMGLDSAKEEMESYERTFLDRGMATFAFDGPGQGEAEYDFPIRGDYEVAVRAVIDAIAVRTDLDGDRIGLWGVSLGGYYAPRAAALEKRVKACIGLSGPYDFGDCWEGLTGLTRAAFRVRSGAASDEEARERAGTLSLKGVAGHITCPLMIVAGKQDRLIPWDHCQRLAREAAGPVELLVVEEGNHVANNRAYAYRPQCADWMARRLDAAPPEYPG